MTLYIAILSSTMMMMTCTCVNKDIIIIIKQGMENSAQNINLQS